MVVRVLRTRYHWPTIHRIAPETLKGARVIKKIVTSSINRLKNSDRSSPVTIRCMGHGHRRTLSLCILLHVVNYFSKCIKVESLIKITAKQVNKYRILSEAE